MKHTVVILIVCLLLVFGAGVGIGVGLSAHHPWQRPVRGSYLAKELGLSPAQRQKIEAIWAEVARHGPFGGGLEARRQLEQQREQAVRDLLTPSQQADYDRILKEYQTKIEALAKERRAAFESAVQKTREMLTPTQRAKYDEMLKNRAEWGRGRGPGHRPPPPGHGGPDFGPPPPAPPASRP